MEEKIKQINAEIEELPCWYEEEKEYDYKPINIKIHFSNTKMYFCFVLRFCKFC